MIAIILAGLLGGQAATPAVQVAPDAPLETCLAAQKPEDDAESYVTACYQASFDRANAALTAGFEALALRLAKDKLSASDVRDAQDHWLAYRDAWCRIEKAGEPDVPSRPLTELQCRTEISLRLLARMRNAWQR